MASSKEKFEVVRPPLPKFLRSQDDETYEAPQALTPENMRAKLQLQAGQALDILEWWASNLSEPKASIDACRELLDRAGYVGPAKPKADGMIQGASSGEAVPSIEDDVKLMNDGFSSMLRSSEE